MNSDDIAKRIKEIGLKFNNMFEVKSNAVWSDPEHSAEIAALMKKAGWQPGWPYCASFVEAVWVKAYTDLKAPKRVLDFISSNLNPSVVSSFENFNKHFLIRKRPCPGAIMFLRKGSSASGHAGIVLDWKSGETFYKTIEANTSPSPGTVEQDRNGDGIFIKTRKLDYESASNKLNLIGFLHPIEW